MSTTLAKRAARAAETWSARVSVDEPAPFSADEARENAALARELCAHVDDDAIWDTDQPLEDFIEDVPEQLAEAGLIDEALALLTLFEESFDGDFVDIVADRARLLAKHGRTDEARAIVDEILSSADGDPDEIARVVEAAAFYDAEKAEELCRVVIDGSSEPLARFVASATLVDLLRDRGANDEADALDAELDHELAHSEDGPEWEVPNPATPPVVRPTPKVGRNEPCPCGGGKKYKKCHGA